MRILSDYDVHIEYAWDEANAPALLIKISSAVLELNVWLPQQNAPALLAFLTGETTSLSAGMCAASAVHWARDSDAIYMLVGVDTECWDVSLIISPDLRQALETAIRQITPGDMGKESCTQ